MWRVAATLCTLGLISAAAHALEAEGALGDELRYAIYGPDWCWQKRDINVMLVFENSGAEDAAVDIALTLPDSDPAPFAAALPLPESVIVPAGETARVAFTQIEVSPDAPRGIYALYIRLEHGSSTVEQTYAVRTVRGAAVSPGAWALYVPVAFTSAWSILIFYSLCRMSSPRAWLEIAPPQEEDAA